MLNRQTLKGLSQFTLLLVGLMVLLAVTGHCAITQQAGSKNSLGSVIEYTNPNSYLLGAIEGGEVIKDPAGRLYTLLTVQPAETFALYTEQLFLCGNRAEDFNGRAHKPLVLTYKRQASRMYGGLACQELKSVYELKDEEALPEMRP